MATQDPHDPERGSLKDVGHASAVSVDMAVKEAADGQVAQFVAEHRNYPPMTPEMEKRIKKKIDAWIIPLVSPASQTCLCLRTVFLTVLS